MANIFSPFGFWQYRGTGSSPTRVNRCRKSLLRRQRTSSRTTRLPASDGDDRGRHHRPGPAPASSPASSSAAITSRRAEAHDLGQLLAGPDVDSATSSTAYFVNDPNAQFVVQAGNSTTVGVVAGNIGSNVPVPLRHRQTLGRPFGRLHRRGQRRHDTSTLPFRICGSSPILRAHRHRDRGLQVRHRGLQQRRHQEPHRPG